MVADLVGSRDGVNIYELLASQDEERLEAMFSLYAMFFPEYAHYVPRMRRRAKLPTDVREGHIAHYWLIEYEGEPIGLTTFRYITKRECGVGVSFAIDTKARSIRVGNQRLSSFVISRIMKALKDDAAHFGTPFHGLITEVEHRNLMEHYKKMGMLELPMKYYEPIYPPEQPDDDFQSRIEKLSFIPVILGITPNGALEFNRRMLRNFAEAFLVDHYELPRSHPMLQKTLNSIK